MDVVAMAGGADWVRGRGRRALAEIRSRTHADDDGAELNR